VGVQQKLMLQQQMSWRRPSPKPNTNLPPSEKEEEKRWLYVDDVSVDVTDATINAINKSCVCRFWQQSIGLDSRQ
jgi:hypothetical protein